MDISLFYGTYPLVSGRYSDSITYSGLKELGTIVVGEPQTVTFYTRADGNWRDANNWSLDSYNGVAAKEYPSQFYTHYKAYIGASHTIVLDQNTNVDDLGTLKGIAIVDSSGVLDFGPNYLTGTGEFRMLKNSTIKLKDPNGITTAPTATGNVRTATRKL